MMNRIVVNCYRYQVLRIFSGADPAALRRRAADKFKLPESKNTVFAYQIQERSPDGTAKSVFAFGPRKTSKELKTAKR